MAIDYKDALRQSVEAGGGQWVGMQDTFVPGQEPLVLFNSPTSKTTLALPVSLCTADNVHGKIHGSDADFQNHLVRVPRRVLQRIADKLEVMLDEVNQILSGE